MKVVGSSIVPLTCLYCTAYVVNRLLKTCLFSPQNASGAISLTMRMHITISTWKEIHSCQHCFFLSSCFYSFWCDEMRQETQRSGIDVGGGNFNATAADILQVKTELRKTIQSRREAKGLGSVEIDEKEEIKAFEVCVKIP